MFLTRNKALFHPIIMAILMLLLASGIAACGETAATATPNSTSPATTTTTSAATSSSTTVAASTTTTSGATGTGVNPLNAATTVPAANTNSAATIPSISNATEVQVDPAFSAAAAKQIPGVSNPTFKIFVSGDDAAKLATNADTAFTAGGYAFAFPGATKPTNTGTTIAGLYTKAGAPDILIGALNIPADTATLTKDLAIPDLTDASAQKFLEQVKGKKSMLIVLSATGLVQSLFNTLGATPPGSNANSNTTPVAATTTDSSATAAPAVTSAVTDNDIAIYPGSKKVNNGAAQIGDTFNEYFLSSDDYSKIAAWAKQASTDKGWEGVAQSEQAGATIITGRKGKYNLIMTILGPQARQNGNFDIFFQKAQAGPNDTVIVVVVTS